MERLVSSPSSKNVCESLGLYRDESRSGVRSPTMVLRRREVVRRVVYGRTSPDSPPLTCGSTSSGEVSPSDSHTPQDQESRTHPTPKT